MVSHQGVGMERAVLFVQGFAQPVEIGQVILLAKETGLAVVASLHDVQRNTIKMDAWATGHRQSCQN